MPGIEYITMTDHAQAGAVTAMMDALYREDPAESAVSHDHFHKTIELFINRPEAGRIILFSGGNTLHGYAILLPFWSNELGGIVIILDELFVVPTSRRQRLARGFFDFVERERPFNAVAMQLEVSPANISAQRAYITSGFRQLRNSVMRKRLPG